MFFQRVMIAISAVAFFLQSSVFAHPGHGADESGESLTHYLVEPFHNWAIILMIALIAGTAISLRLRHSKSQRVSVMRSKKDSPRS
ncbi:hypothetical protein [Thalassoglobus polymorphus]|uniref:Cobalt transport protein CbiN n=1 Tax=Thalassoglobus polymorphus TaxID=2527994 RepID=A0A517QPL4_9PLAN|nr:hypothetical protein [Thalassoglobus polymorphus]QDT33544.1 hypothetical protein Mal48_27970 [Thalassoglobus polymorphus]